jgi:uncharacterized membrane protein (DUF485 family)
MFAGLYAILGIIFMLVKSPTADPKDTSMVILGFVSLFLFIGLPVLAVWYYKNQGYPVTLGKSIKLGVLVGLLGGLLVAIYAYIYFAYINPAAVDHVLEMSRKILEENGNFSSEMVENQMEITKKFFVPMQFLGQIFTGLLYGLIGGLIGGLFFKTPTEDY